MDVRQSLRKDLLKENHLVLVPTAPFHFDSTVFNPSHFPARDEFWQPGSYWQTLRWKRENYGIRLVNKGTTSRPRIDVTIFSDKVLSGEVIQEVADELRWRFDLGSKGVPEFVKRFKNDNHLASIIRQRPGMRPKSAYSLYEYLVITVLLQNTVVRRSISMLQALFERYGKLLKFDGQELWTFWDPEEIARASEEELRALKLGYRAKTLKRQAEQFVQREIDELTLRENRDKVDLAAALDRIYGVGPQSAWYMLFEFFHFYDALEHISPWEAKIVGRVLFNREVAAEKTKAFLIERYGEFRQLAFHYLMTDVFWRHRKRPVPWLAELIRL